MLYFSASPQVPAAYRRNCDALGRVALRNLYVIMETMRYCECSRSRETASFWKQKVLREVLGPIV